ncbi:MAG: hypothetical protein EXR86_04270 [Gammaproteobacteria bacterium]|nr:hypothetical protein [Gammaproteobacteria bacterium]
MNDVRSTALTNCNRRRWLPIVIALLWAAPLIAEEDWERRAAEAAQTEKGFFESGGARDPNVPISPAQPTPGSTPAHILEADQKVAAQQAARLAAQREAEQTAVTRLTNQLQISRYEHANQLSELQGLLSSAQSKLTAAEQSKDKQKIATQTGVVAIFGEQIRAKTQEIVGYEQRLQLEITKAQAEPRAQEEATRVARATDLARAVTTRQTQIEVAAQFEKDRQKVLEAHQAWLAQQQVALASATDALAAAYSDNRNDGIGPQPTPEHCTARYVGRPPPAAVIRHAQSSGRSIQWRAPKQSRPPKRVPNGWQPGHLRAPRMSASSTKSALNHCPISHSIMPRKRAKRMVHGTASKAGF